MKKLFLLVPVLIISYWGFSQNPANGWLRSFPITDYQVELNDSMILVQLELPKEHQIKYKQAGKLVGVYHDAHSDTASNGYGRCYLIKGEYSYFAISPKNKSSIKEGDLVYTIMDTTEIFYGRVPKLASHFIQLQNVQGDRMFDRYIIFLKWTKEDEENLLDSMVRDIQFTGSYFAENDNSMDAAIEKGSYKGRKVLEIMINCKKESLTDFIDYVLARPRLYAGREWKVSEIFATWLMAGAPAIVKVND